MKGLTLMVIMLYFHCKIVINYPGPNPPNPGLGPRVNPGFGFEKQAGYPSLRSPGAPALEALDPPDIIISGLAASNGRHL